MAYTKKYFLNRVKDWLLAEGIDFDRVNDHNPDNVAQYGDGGNAKYMASWGLNALPYRATQK